MWPRWCEEGSVELLLLGMLMIGRSRGKGMGRWDSPEANLQRCTRERIDPHHNFDSLATASSPLTTTTTTAILCHPHSLPVTRFNNHDTLLIASLLLRDNNPSTCNITATTRQSTCSRPSSQPPSRPLLSPRTPPACSASPECPTPLPPDSQLP